MRILRIARANQAPHVLPCLEICVLQLLNNVVRHRSDCRIDLVGVNFEGAGPGFDRIACGQLHPASFDVRHAGMRKGFAVGRIARLVRLGSPNIPYLGRVVKSDVVRDYQCLFARGERSEGDKSNRDLLTVCEERMEHRLVVVAQHLAGNQSFIQPCQALVVL